MKESKALSSNPWESKGQRLYLHKPSGKYYARFWARGKQFWIDLETDLLRIARLRLPDEAAKFNKTREARAQVTAGSATMGDLMETYLERCRGNEDLRPATIVAYETDVKKVRKTWQGIDDLAPDKITPRMIWDWADRLKIDGTNFTPPGAKRALKGNSAASVNRAINALRHVLDIAVERGQIYSNPALAKPPMGRLKKKITPKKLSLPNTAEIKRMIDAMEKQGEEGGWQGEAAYFCRFLAASGARLGEAAKTTWGDVDWTRKTIHLPGYKTETSDRILPLFPELEIVLKKIWEWRRAVPVREDRKDLSRHDSTIFRIRECQKSIDAACVKAEVSRITHHDFRHLFATVCIEAGVDIPTVSKWLGHNDGGVLVMKTYGHLRNDHSQASAQKVSFGLYAVAS